MTPNIKTVATRVWRKKTFSERFWSHVKRNPTGCWEWVGCHSSTGYGITSAGERSRSAQAHRVAWMLTYGRIQRGRFVLHRCDNRGCVRPDHLFLGTHTDNMRDCARKGRIAVKFGDQNHAAKLTAAAVVAIRAAVNSRLKSEHDLALELNLHPSTIHRIVRRRAWPHVE